jgi:four helix bundle protein
LQVAGSPHYFDLKRQTCKLKPDILIKEVLPVATAERFEDLRVWQEARGIVRQVYQMTATFPKTEWYSLSSQIQRAAVSAMSNIAEGFERGTNKEFIYFLYVAKGSIGEVRSQTYAAFDLGYIPQETCKDLVRQCETLSRRVYSFIEYLKQSPYKGPKFREPGPVWHLNESETFNP